METEQSPLTSEHVTEVFQACLAEDADSHTAVTVEGIVHTAAFDRPALADHHEEIGAMLAELPLPFQPAEQGGGGGWSFLNACNDKHDHQWTGFHLIIEQLLLLGLATGQATIVMPRDLWDILPGGMPYIAVTPHSP